MRLSSSACLVACAALLTACGGGGGGGSSPAPIVPLPSNPPASFDIANMTTNQTFEVMGNQQTSRFDLTNGTVASSQNEMSKIKVAYNASSRNYTVTLGSETGTFGPSDIKSNANGEVRYDKGDTTTGREILTLVTTPYYGSSTSNRYVGMGYWQRYSVSASQQDDRFSTFVYGQQTPLASMPRSGTGQFNIDVFGVASFTGYSPSVFQGGGTFNVDFLSGDYSAHAYTNETELLTGYSVSGGIEFTGAGKLVRDSTDFDGSVMIRTRHGTSTGELHGSFFGPTAQEVGASFSAYSLNGGRIVGSFTGQALGPSQVNLRLSDLVTNQRLWAIGNSLDVLDGPNGKGASYMSRRGPLDYNVNGSFTLGTDAPHLTFTAADKVQSEDNNFTSYVKSAGDGQGNNVYLQMYKVGAANSELVLSYVSLGRWQYSFDQMWGHEQRYQHFHYGLLSGEGLLSRRTGTANYEGVVYGAAGQEGSTDVYDVRGTSRFAVNFTDQKFNSTLNLNGTRNGSTVDFGSYDFNGALHKAGGSGVLLDNNTEYGNLDWNFYGPQGEEIGGAFWIKVPKNVRADSPLITGVTVARQR